MLVCQIIPYFHLSLDFFYIVLCIKLGFIHPLDFANNFWNLWGFTFFVARMVRKGRPCMMLCEILLRSLWEMQDFMSHENRPMSFCSLPYSVHAIELTLCYHLMVYAHRQMLWSSTPFALIWFHRLLCSFSWSYDNSCDSDKGWSLLWWILNKQISPYNYRSLHISTLTSGHVPS